MSGFEIFALSLFVLALGFYLFTCYTVVKTPFASRSEKGIWLAIVIIAPFIGSLVFWVMRPGILRQTKIQPNRI